jgi:hypothetical protein
MKEKMTVFVYAGYGNRYRWSAIRITLGYDRSVSSVNPNMNKAFMVVIFTIAHIFAGCWLPKSVKKTLKR